MTSWYEEHVEAPIRERVRLLRDNGFNSEQSCGHRDWIQIQLLRFDEVDRLDGVLTRSGERDYIIEATLRRDGGHQSATATVFFGVGDDKRFPVQSRRVHAEEFTAAQEP
jgi:hypothetical protein